MGMSDAERARRYRDRKRGGPPRELKPHGTRAAVRRHERAGEELCDECDRFERRRQHMLYLKRRGVGRCNRDDCEFCGPTTSVADQRSRGATDGFAAGGTAGPPGMRKVP